MHFTKSIKQGINRSQRFLLLIIVSVSALPLFAQDVITSADSTKVTDTSRAFIASVKISGNKKTKSYIILREMQFHVGDSIRKDKLPVEILQARNQVYNTNLFTEVKIDSVYLNGDSLVVNVHVREKWYIYPTPQFQIADRSYSEWINRYHASLDRVVYGVKFVHNNFSGRRDQLRLSLTNGYARNVTLSYNNPYSNTALNRGFGFFVSYSQGREIGYQTDYYNKILNYKPGGFIRKSYSAGISMSQRIGFFRTQALSLSISYIDVTDSILTKYNPGYFNSPESKQVIPALGYNFRYLNTNNNNYPLKGKSYAFGISKSGTAFKGGLNNLNVTADISKYFTHKNNLYSTVQLAGFIRLPFDQPYVNRRAMGFGGFYMRGLEKYVIDGVASALIKYTFRKKLFSFNIPVPFHIKALPVIPVNLFAKTYADAGYTYIKSPHESRLNNRMLYSGGFGLDILTLYDINIKLEYSFNQLGEKGLFLHGKGNF